MFKKSVVVGVSVTPERGLEVAEVDYATRTVVKYGQRQIDYNVNAQEIGDMDLFKESLQELFAELNIQKGAEVVLNLPTLAFKVNDYPAALDDVQISNAVEEELYEIEKFKSYEPCFSIAELPNSSIQFKKVAYTAVVKSTIIELILYLKELGYKVKGIDTSVSSVLNSLIYLERVNTEPGMNWVLMIIENNSLKIISMQGKNFLDAFTEKIAISEVLSDAENYATVIAAAEPILKNLPAKYLCVVSKTNVISAGIISNKITYSAPVTYQEANCFLKQPLMSTSALVNPEAAKMMTLDIIGAAIYFPYVESTYVHFNLFNSTLGDVYFSEQPPEITINGKRIVLSDDALISYFIVFVIIFGILFGTALSWLFIQIKSFSDQKEDINHQISEIDLYLKKNENISQELFDEGDEIKIGLVNNKNIYSYYTIVGTEIPQKLWLTYLKLGEKTTIEGQADNLESVYAFFRNIKDYTPNSDLKLQKLGLAVASNGLSALNENGDFDTESLLTTLNADYYEFRISNEPEPAQNKEESTDENSNPSGLPLEPIR